MRGAMSPEQEKMQILRPTMQETQVLKTDVSTKHPVIVMCV